MLLSVATRTAPAHVCCVIRTVIWVEDLQSHPAEIVFGNDRQRAVGAALANCALNIIDHLVERPAEDGLKVIALADDSEFLQPLAVPAPRLRGFPSQLPIQHFAAFDRRFTADTPIAMKLSLVRRVIYSPASAAVAKERQKIFAATV